MKYGIACVSTLFLLAAGCDEGPAKESEESVDVRILDWKETQALVASHRGKVVVLDIWATTCPPCIRELPGLVALQKKHGRDRLACITVSCDYIGLEDESPDSLREPVLERLRKVNATGENVLLSIPSDDFLGVIDLASIPAVYVYGKDGELVTRFDNDSGRYGDEGFTYEGQISPLVEKLLAAK